MVYLHCIHNQNGITDQKSYSYFLFLLFWWNCTLHIFVSFIVFFCHNCLNPENSSLRQVQNNKANATLRTINVKCYFWFQRVCCMGFVRQLVGCFIFDSRSKYFTNQNSHSYFFILLSWLNQSLHIFITIIWSHNLLWYSNIEDNPFRIEQR